MKRLIMYFISFSLILLTTGCGKEILISKDQTDLIGIWSLTEYNGSDKDDVTVEEATFSIKENGECVLNQTMRVNNGGSTFKGKASGKCYVNSKGDKFKMDSKDSTNFFDKWQNLNVKDKELTIGNYKFKKIK